MKDIIILQERLTLVEQELKTLTEKIDKIAKATAQTDDLKEEIRALKVFIGRVHPEFKSQFPEIVKKI